MVLRDAQDADHRCLNGWARTTWVVLALIGLTLALSSAAWSEEKEEGGAGSGSKTYAWRSAGTDGLGVRGLEGLRLHPRNPSYLWAYVHGMGPARSDDGGRTWTTMLKGVSDRLRPGRRSQVRVSLDPRDARIMYVVIDGHIHRSEDSGASWETITSGALASLSWDRLRNTHLCWEVQVDPKKSVHLLVGTRTDGDHNGGLYESGTGGKNWERIAGSAMSDSGLGNDTLFVRQSPKTDKDIVVAGRTAVYLSEDRGRTFVRNDPGGGGTHDIRWVSEYRPSAKEIYVADARGVWRSRDYGKRWDKAPSRAGDAVYVTIDVHNKRRVLSVFHDSGLWMSTKHARWSSMGGAYAAEKDAPVDPEAGYRRAEIREIFTHPREKKTIYAASPATGLHVSTDDGKSFAPVEPPETAKPEQVIPTVMPQMAAVGVHPAEGGLHLAVNEFGMVYRSEDRGGTWKQVGRLGMAASILQPDAEDHAWLAAGRRLLRSTDDGATWETLYEPADPEERILALHRGTTEGAGVGTLRLLLQRSGVVVTRKAGEEKWAASKAPRFPSSARIPAFATTETWAAGLAVDPANGDHQVIAARTTSEIWSTRDPNGGVYETWDGGRTWQDITGALPPDGREKPEIQKSKMRWNRGRFALVDPSSSLLLYGADGRGILVRPWVDPQGEKPATKPAWVDLTPDGCAGAHINAYVHTMTADRTDTRLVVQLRLPDGTTALHSIAGRTLRALFEYVLAKEKPDEKPHWTALASPGTKVHLGGLTADGQLPGRLLGTDAEGALGVLIYEIPGSQPTKKKGVEEEEPGEKDGAAAPALAPPEGMRAFTASADKSLRIWRVDTGESTHNLEEHEDQVLCVALTPDEQFLLSGGYDKKLNIWNAVSAKIVATIPTEANINAIACDDDSAFAYLALEEKQQVLQVDMATKALRPFIGHSGGVLAVATSEDTNRVYSGGRDQTIRVWDTKEAAEVVQISMGSKVVSLAVARDGSRIYAVGGDGTIKAFDAAGEEVGAIPAPGAEEEVHGIRLSPDDTTLYVARSGGVLAVSTSDLKAGRLYGAPEKTVVCVAVSADDKWLLAGDSDGGLWLWATGDSAPRWSRGKAHETAVLGVALTPDETPVPEDAPPDGPPK